MIVLEFIADADPDNCPDPDALMELPLEVLDETCYELPISFVIEGFDLLKYPDGQNKALPLLLLAVSGRRKVENLAPGDSAVIFITDAGKMHLRREGDQVALSTTRYTREVKAGYLELRTAFRDFSRSVRVYLLLRFPEITEHPRWDNWWADLVSE